MFLLNNSSWYRGATPGDASIGISGYFVMGIVLFFIYIIYKVRKELKRKK